MNAGNSQIRILAAESCRRLFIEDRRMIRTAMLCGSLLYLLLSAVPIQALDPNLRLTQYMHKSWATKMAPCRLRCLQSRKPPMVFCGSQPYPKVSTDLMVFNLHQGHCPRAINR